MIGHKTLNKLPAKDANQEFNRMTQVAFPIHRN